jgi:hypothetical protein
MSFSLNRHIQILKLIKRKQHSVSDSQIYSSNIYVYIETFPDKNECTDFVEACEYGGTCVNRIGGFECICPRGRTGPTCSDGKSTISFRFTSLVVR